MTGSGPIDAVAGVGVVLARGSGSAHNQHGHQNQKYADHRQQGERHLQGKCGDLEKGDNSEDDKHCPDNSGHDEAPSAGGEPQL